MPRIQAGEVKFYRSDMSDAAAPGELVAQARAWQGGAPVAVLVNNVGIQVAGVAGNFFLGNVFRALTREKLSAVLQGGPSSDRPCQVDNGKPAHLLEEELWDKVMNVNLKSYFLMAKHSLPSMIEQGSGLIVNIASVQGLQSQVGIPAYASSKGGILSLTRQMAMDYSNEGVRVVAVSPGTIRTPLVQRLVEEDGVMTCDELGRQCATPPSSPASHRGC